MEIPNKEATTTKMVGKDPCKIVPTFVVNVDTTAVASVGVVKSSAAEAANGKAAATTENKEDATSIILFLKLMVIY